MERLGNSNRPAAGPAAARRRRKISWAVLRPLAAAIALATSLAPLLAQNPTDQADAAAHQSRGLAALAKADYATARTELEAARDGFQRLGNALGVAQTDLSLAHQAEMTTDRSE